ncbi:MAG: aquaporin [Opitutae bacterium]|nr:aquaporin [Opitutae bacterium]|tara:strand:- start:1704 stop:2345 length:642 start_codon:yes stop_codon:yes gene_type:complete
MKKLSAEFLGTFVMLAVGTGAVAIDDESVLGIALAFGVSVGLMILMFGKVSGAHFNPVVSITFALHGKMAKRELIPYLLAQCLGAAAGSFLVYSLKNKPEGLTLPSEELSTFLAFGIEIGITFVLMFVILRAPCMVGPSISRIATLVGATIAINAYLFGPMTGASMNPARTLGPAWVAGNLDFLWLYVFAPCTGGLIALAIHKAVPPKEKGCC